MTIPELIPFNTTTTVCKECDNIKNPPELAFISTTCCGFISTVVQFNSPAINTTGGSCLNYLFISTFIIDETSTPSASIIATLLDSCIDFLSTL